MNHMTTRSQRQRELPGRTAELFREPEALSSNTRQSQVRRSRDRSALPYPVPRTPDGGRLGGTFRAVK